jgi:hypothetical protein
VPPSIKKTATNPNPDNPRKKPQFSIVITQVEHDIDENDISQTLASLELPFVRLWRIKSRQTNKFTKLIRVITEDTVTVDFLLNNGINLFGNHHQCEPSKPPEPTPLQCTKCYQLGHPATACTNKPACLKCPETHAPNNCEAATPKCLLCGGAHVAWSRKCPKFKDTPITDETHRSAHLFHFRVVADAPTLVRPNFPSFMYSTPPSTAAAPGGRPNPTNANGRKFSEFISDLPIYRLENRSATFISHGNVDAQSIVDHIVITESLTAHVDSESFIGTTSGGS